MRFLYTADWHLGRYLHGTFLLEDQARVCDQFVDEGFGTLDPDALDLANRTLTELQQAGRMAGIISHVAELKECIDARLELKASQTGSEATFAL